MEYNLNENYNKNVIIKNIKDYLKNIACINTDFEDLDKKDKDMIKYHNLMGLSSYLIYCCYTFIKNDKRFKSVVKQKFKDLQNDCNILEISTELKSELIKNCKIILDMIDTMK